MKDSKRKFKKGDRVQRKNDLCTGTVAQIKERGVAGSAVTYIDWIKVAFDNGMVEKAQPYQFTLLEDD